MFHVSKSPIVVLLVLFVLPLWGQGNQLKGLINGPEGPLPYATVLLKSSIDSAVVKVEVSTENGTFLFSEIASGTYWLEASYVGLATFQSTLIRLGKDEVRSLDPFVLQATTANLETVEVTALKPMVEVKADMTVFNVENTLNSIGTNGFDLLRKAPGVIIDNNDNLILDGKGGVQVMINGKLSPLSGNDLTNYLRTLQASDIAAIEIITQPSSKYDAAGNAGLINIRLKKDRRLGTNGSLNSGFAYGKNDRYNASFSLNHRNTKSNWFVNYSNNLGQSWNFLYLDRIQQQVRYDSKTETLDDNQAHNIKLGLDLFPSDKHTLGVLVNGNFYQSDARATTNTPITPFGQSQPVQILVANNRSDNNNLNLSGNLNYRFADTLGHELLLDVDYGTYQRDRTSFQPNAYLDAATQTSILDRDFRMITPTDINIFTVKADYSQRLFGGTLSVGAKYARVETANDFIFYDVIDNIDQLNAGRSNQFNYRENVNAAYGNFNKQWKKWNIQVGIRAEETLSLGELTSTQSSAEDNVRRRYLNWFPSGGVTFAQNPSNSWALNYSRRITRPNYQSLNPFEYQLDELSFGKGNPFLQPQYATNLKLSHTYKYRLTTSVSYSRISDFFAQITDTLGATRNFLITRNIADQQVWTLGVSYPFSFTKWWSVYLSVNAFRSTYQGNDDKFVPIAQSTLSFYGQNTFSLPADFKLEVSGWFSSPSVWGGTYLSKSLGSLDLALQKSFGSRLSARLAWSDILFTSPWIANMRYGDLAINGTGGWESRQVKIDLQYTFGRTEIKGSRRRDTGLKDESNRVGN